MIDLLSLSRERSLSPDDRTAISALYDSWSEVLSAGAIDIAVGAKDQVWAVLADASDMRSVAAWDDGAWNAVQAIDAERIAVDPDGVPWIARRDGQIYTYRTDQLDWERRPGCAVDLAIGADGSVWGVGCPAAAVGGRAIYRWNGVDWDEASGDQGGARVAVDPQGIPWLVDTAGNIYRRSTSTAEAGHWQLLPGVARDIAVSAGGTPWAVGAIQTLGGYKLYVWDESPSDGSTYDGQWLAVTGGGLDISVGTVGPWIRNNQGAIYRQSAEKPPYQ